jgi:carboxylesterase
MPSANPYLHNAEYPGDGFILKGSSNGILLFHGFTATVWEVKGLAEFIQNNTGMTVSAPLLPGHGTSPQDLSNCQFQDWLQAAETAYTAMRETSNSVIVGGESMGALLGLYLAAKYPEVKGLLLFAPALVIPGIFQARFLKWLLFGYPKKNLEKPREGFLPWQGYRINPLNAVVELGKLQSAINQLLPNVIQPTLIFQGDRDETIDKNGSKIIYNAISSSSKQLITVENCGHCILLDKQYPHIYQMALQFTQQVQLSV